MARRLVTGTVTDPVNEAREVVRENGASQRDLAIDSLGLGQIQPREQNLKPGNRTQSSRSGGMSLPDAYDVSVGAS